MIQFGNAIRGILKLRTAKPFAAVKTTSDQGATIDVMMAIPFMLILHHSFSAALMVAGLLMYQDALNRTHAIQWLVASYLLKTSKVIFFFKFYLFNVSIHLDLFVVKF